MGLRFEVLGAVQAVVDGQGVRPVSELRRRLLAVLLVRANRSVAVDTLVEALWGPDAPQRPGSNLQLHVHRLRQVLDRPDRLRGVRRLPSGRRPG
ncbi:winged helix-turn-helix domain-containing protein [Kribbella speibonae]|uniref:winged helix-turn-helix domain-containing protein n=1 Tax=Kribbella speibonae TaxID=1572660 RepID=UPI001EDEE480|nr:winged helix-turn-helix domain-containing protein [Kribbella speibonae]